MFWKLILVLAQVTFSNPDLLKQISTDVKQFIDLVKEIWGEDGKNVVVQSDLESSGLLEGRAGGLIDLIKWLVANPDALQAILVFLRAIGVLKS